MSVYKSLGHSIRFFILVSLMLACGENSVEKDRPTDSGTDSDIENIDAGDSSSETDGHTDEDISGDAGEVDARDPIDEWVPEDGEQPDCENGQIACRGTCFDNTEGEQANGCELVMGSDSDLFTIIADGDSLIAVVGVSNFDQDPKLVRISTDSFTMETIATVSLDINPRLDLIGDHIYFTAPAVVEGEIVNGLHRVASSGGTPEQVLTLSSNESLYRFIEKDIFLLDRNTPVMRAPLEGGTPEEVIALTNIEDIQLDDTYYYMSRGYPDFDQVRAPIDAPDDVELIELGGSRTARFLRWPQDPDHIYIYDTDYWKIDSSSDRGELIAETPFVALGFDKGKDHLLFSESYSRGTEEVVSVVHSVAMKWDDGSLETIDTLTSSSIAETDLYYYVIRDRALLRYER